ncbi:DNA-binding SARP family transcriptional activator/tetratricopeptide (TPR) repeat protein [Nocardioides cavernae]|uniref:ATP-binding protein n=1 Tax=Nocardioides cavernae TaxID=1921566 RepID=UPI0027DBBCDC|nr:BTAD domain-containing putative transcriptional regulator [Nocardioides cavernae]MBM7512000.1 DNA-binding SARP family transcriptional activator/tetratricopeptide (TPR) repeat protein [Nocardioides cavernae]
MFSTHADEPGQVRLQVLGPLRVWRDDTELALGPRQQEYLLALLLARVGRPTSVSELIDLLWDDDVPRSAINILQKYVGAIRRVLEPALAVRESGAFVQRRGGGYILSAVPGAVDLVDFRLHVEGARRHVASGRPDDASDDYARALALWHGPAGDGLTHSRTAVPLFAGLDNEFFDACVSAAALARTQGHSERVVQPLRLAAWMAPLHEPVQASLVDALAASGRQAEALSVLDGVRTRLVEELGVSPGHDLRAAHARALGEAADSAGTASRSSSTSTAVGPTPPHPRSPSDADGAGPSSLVGRAEELGTLMQSLDRAIDAHASLVLVEGEPGAGKTSLLEELGKAASQHGATVAWGRCLSHEGIPALWPWTQVLTELRRDQPPDVQAAAGVGELGRLLEPGDDSVLGGAVLPDSGAQFRLFEQAVSLVARASAGRPLVLVLDDMQWADLASLQMFKHVASQQPSRVLLVGILRDRAPRPGVDLSRTLAAVGRLAHHQRIHLGPLQPAEVAELVRRETGRAPTAAIARSIQARTEGNPFFVRELARLMADGNRAHAGEADRGVPSTVRDIVRDRMSTLDEVTQVVIQRAALMGREVDLRLLARASGLDVEACIALLDPADALALLTTNGTPFNLAFAHDLVRESVIQSTSPVELGRFHLQIAGALETAPSRDESDDERLAHHLRLAGPLADAERTTTALLRAGRRAISRSAFDSAATHLQGAAAISREAGLLELELSALSQLVAVIGMQSGYMGDADSTSALLERAETVARALGRERAAADFLFTHWAAHSQAIQLDRSGDLARRLLVEGERSEDPVVQAYGRHAWGIHQWDVGNVGDAYRFLSESNAVVRTRSRSWDDDEPLRHDLQLLSPAMLALNTVLHGKVTEGRALFGSIEADAGDHSYDVTVWSSFAVTAAALVSDTHWAARAADRGIAADPEHAYVFLGAYQRLGRCWSRALTGQDAEQATAEAEALIDAHLREPTRSGLTTWLALLAEMYLVCGRPAVAEDALDRAFDSIDTYGQRYAEGFVRLMQARLMHATGTSTSRVRMAAEEARSLARAREVHLFESQAADFIARLQDSHRINV